MLAYHQKWLAGCEVTEESLAQALFLEADNVKSQQIAINNGICMFFEE